MKTLIPAVITAALLGGQTATFERAEPRPSNLIGYVSGDFNGDGRLDLVGGVNNTGLALTIFLGAADGGFENGRLFSVEREVDYPEVAADFNRDGHLDLAAHFSSEFNQINGWIEGVQVYLGDGKGGFAPGARATMPGNWHEGLESAVADLNRDGKPDLVVHLYYWDPVGTWHVLLGGGDGSFQLLPPFHEGVMGRPVLADLNADGIPDLVIQEDSTDVWLGAGDGTFRKGSPATADALAGGVVATADFDRDGRLDLAKTNGELEAVILFGNGDGSFRKGSPIRSSSRNTGGPGSVWAADLNGDGIPDLVVSYRRPWYVSLLPGNGDGTFGDPMDLGDGYPSLAPADLNGDGRLDLAMIESAQRTNNLRSNFLLLNTTPARLAERLVEARYAPGMLASIHGWNLAPKPAETKVRVKGLDAAVIFASPGQVNFRVPVEVAVGPARLELENNIARLEAGAAIVANAPFIFTLNKAGAGAILHGDGTPVTADSPARAGESITILCTGLGRLDQTIRVTVGGVTAAVRTLNADPGLAGLQRVEIVVPEAAPRGPSLGLKIEAGGVESNTVTIATG